MQRATPKRGAARLYAELCAGTLQNQLLLKLIYSAPVLRELPPKRAQHTTIIAAFLQNTWDYSAFFAELFSFLLDLCAFLEVFLQPSAKMASILPRALLPTIAGAAATCACNGAFISAKTR